MLQYVRKWQHLRWLADAVAAWMFLLKIRDNDRGGHGDKFKAKMKEINEATCPDAQVQYVMIAIKAVIWGCLKLHSCCSSWLVYHAICCCCLFHWQTRYYWAGNLRSQAAPGKLCTAFSSG